MLMFPLSWYLRLLPFLLASMSCGIPDGTTKTTISFHGSSWERLHPIPPRPVGSIHSSGFQDCCTPQNIV